MRVCLIGTFPCHPDDVKGGVANVILYLAQAFMAKGHDVHVVVPTSEPGDSASWLPLNVHYINFSRLLPQTLLNVTSLKVRIQNRIREIDPDISHFHGTATYCLGFDAPHVLTLHGISELDARFSRGLSGLKSLVQARIEGYCRRRVDNLIVINPYIGESLGAQLTGRCWHIENPVAGHFFGGSVSSRTKDIVFAGMISTRKNVLGTLHAFKQAYQRDSALRLKIIGPARDPDYLEVCRRYILDNDLSDAVIFMGGLRPEAIANELRRSLCLLLLSIQETAPLIIAEAMACGLPVIASDVGGVRHMIRQGVTGFLVQPEDYAGCAAHIAQLVSNPADFASLSERGQVESERRFQIDGIADRTLSLYRELVTTWESGAPQMRSDI